MNKALHVFVYLFLIGVGAALWYEFQLNDKRSELRDRNKLLEDYIVKQIAPQAEDGAKYAGKPLPAEFEAEIDSDDPFDPGVSIPRMEPVIGKIKRYNATLEETTHDRIVWGDAERQALRDAFIIDPATGKPKMEGAVRKTEESVADKKLAELVAKFAAQNEQFKKTREALPELRERLIEVINKYNDLTPHLRAYIQTNINQTAEIEDLTKQKAELEADKVKLQDDIKTKREEIEGLRGDLDAAKEETDSVRDDLEKQVKLVEALKKQIQTLIQQQQTIATKGAVTSAGNAVGTLPYGDKGSILVADNECLFAIVKFDEKAMKELKPEPNSPLPMIELSVLRKGHEGPAGELVGRIRLRQEVPDKNYVLCDILTNWSQDELKKGDRIFSIKD